MNLRRFVGRVSGHSFLYHGETKLLSENDEDLCFVLDLHKLEFILLLQTLKQQHTYCRSTQTRYSDSEQTFLCPLSPMLRSKY